MFFLISKDLSRTRRKTQLLTCTFSNVFSTYSLFSFYIKLFIEFIFWGIFIRGMRHKPLVFSSDGSLVGGSDSACGPVGGNLRFPGHRTGLRYSDTDSGLQGASSPRAPPTPRSPPPCLSHCAVGWGTRKVASMSKPLKIHSSAIGDVRMRGCVQPPGRESVWSFIRRGFRKQRFLPVVAGQTCRHYLQPNLCSWHTNPRQISPRIPFSQNMFCSLTACKRQGNSKIRYFFN